MKGFYAICRDCTVERKDSFQGSEGPVFQLHLEGHGFAHVCRSGIKSEAEMWPDAGVTVDVSFKLERTKDGTFRLGPPFFKMADMPSMKKPSAA